MAAHPETVCLEVQGHEVLFTKSGELWVHGCVDDIIQDNVLLFQIYGNFLLDEEAQKAMKKVVFISSNSQALTTWLEAQRREQKTCLIQSSSFQISSRSWRRIMLRSQPSNAMILKCSSSRMRQGRSWNRSTRSAQQKPVCCSHCRFQVNSRRIMRISAAG